MRSRPTCECLAMNARAGAGAAARRANSRSQKRMAAYPHKLSGGMCQRVMIAMAISCNPALLIADEPTTGLDVTTQKVVMDLLTGIAAERGMATILITHDLGLAARYCRRVVVMEQGRLVEEAEPKTSSARHSILTPNVWWRLRPRRVRGSRTWCRKRREGGKLRCTSRRGRSRRRVRRHCWRCRNLPSGSMRAPRRWRTSQ